MHQLLLSCILLGGAPECKNCGPGPTFELTLDAAKPQRGLLYWRLHPDSSRNGMPQTCYDPRFGCYPGNNRHLHRHPAFHGTFYRTPYNYRQVMEYPWHAAPHDPEPLTPPGYTAPAPAWMD